jgi:O-antigen/teichoic acid export membrane protein
MSQTPSTAARRVLDTFRERLLSGFSWSLMSTISLQGSVLLTSIVVARLLGLEDFGIYALLVSTVMTVAGIAQGGTGLIATKFVGELLSTDAPRVGRILRMCSQFTALAGAITAALLFLLAPVVADALLGKPQVEPYVRWIAIAIVFQVVVAYQHGALQGFGAFQQISRAGIIAGLLHFGICIAGTWMGGLLGALIGFTLACASRAAIFSIILRQVCASHQISATGQIRPADWRLVWDFALPASLAGLVSLTSLWGVTVLVARQPDGLAWVAVFSVAHQLRATALQLPTLLNGVSFSVLSRLKGRGERENFRAVFWTNMAAGLSFVIALSAILGYFSREILSLFGAEFIRGENILIVLLASTLIELASTTTYQLIQSSGQMWRSFFAVTIPRDSLYITLSIPLLSTHGVLGVAIAYCAAWFLALIVIASLVISQGQKSNLK